MKRIIGLSCFLVAAGILLAILIHNRLVDLILAVLLFFVSYSFCCNGD